MTEKQALKVHGFVFSSGSDDSSGLSDFDDEYYAARPPPIPLQGLENRIVRIRALSISEINIPKKEDDNQADQGKSPKAIPQSPQGGAKKKKAAQRRNKPNQKNQQSFAGQSNVATPQKSEDETRFLSMLRQEQARIVQERNAILAAKKNQWNDPQPGSTNDNLLKLNQNSFSNENCNPSTSWSRARSSRLEEVARLPDLPPTMSYAEAAKNLVVKKLLIEEALPEPPASSSRFNETDISRDSGIFTVFPPESARNESIKNKQRNRNNNVPVTTQLMSVRPPDVSVQSRIVTREETPEEDTRSVGTRCVYALRRFFCCEVDEDYNHM